MEKNGIIGKLDVFIKKYYKNQIIRGSLYSLILLLSFFIFLSVIEYYGYFPKLIRTIIFYGFILLSILQIYFKILIPLLKYNKLGKRITYTQASQIIGEFFPEVSDKLINLLQLQNLSNLEDTELLEASIKQRTQELSPIPFVKAIDFSKNKKYLKWAVIPILSILLILIIYPELISEPTNRYINYTKHFSPPSPFEFVLVNKSLDLLEKDDIEIKVKTIGKTIPNDVDIVINKNKFHMKKIKKNEFSFIIKHVQNETDFYFASSKLKSREYKLNLRPKPIIIDLKAKITYPSYTNLSEEIFTNISNFSIPKGSKIEWVGITKDTRKVVFEFLDKKQEIIPDKRGGIKLSRKLLKDIDYRIYTQNQFHLSSDSLEFKINIIPDLKPQIAVLEQRDSIIGDRIFFRGQIKDDYGFTKLCFKVEVVDEYKTTHHKEIIIPINKNEIAQEFYYYFDLNSIQANSSDQISYYFEVWDNDEVDGAKKSVSQVFRIEIPSIEEIEEKTEKTSQQIEKETQESIFEIKKLREEIKDLKKKILEKKSSDWQDKKQIEEMINKQKEIKNKIEDIKENIKENNIIEEKYKEHSQEILEKKKELERLFEELVSDEMKKMLEELEKMIKDNADKNKIKEELDKLNSRNQDLEKELDRNLEMFKRLELEKKIEETLDKLNQTAKKEEELSQKTKDKALSKEELSKEQNKINETFQEIKKELDKINEKGKKLEDQLQIDRNKEKEESIEEDLKKAMDNIQKGNNKEASQSQKSASEKMEEMASELNESMEDTQEEELAEDINEVRQILKNLVTLSFTQEDLINKVAQYSVTDPKYQDLIYNQNKIKNDMRMISDSLFAMSKRQPQISSAINKELTSIDNQIENSIESLLKYNQGIYNNYKNLGARTPQQYTMTSMNNLALMLAESLKNMQNQMQNSKKSKSKSKGMPKSSCSNPKPGKSSKDLKKMQEALNKEMERLKKELENQKKSNQGKPKIGENAKMNEELARMASQQEMIRRILSEMALEEKALSGKSNPALDNLIRQMEQTEKDIVNKNINQQTLNRQNNILSRLLEHEKAQLEREKQKERESKQGEDWINNNNEFLEFEKLRKRDIELFKQVPPNFSPYYKNKVDEYFLNINSN
ncbi:MAG: hypothetical protein PHP27_04285 [Bacteroidales bacterium]|nr:hypothetical protein [Bacteroidales bacterium]